MAYHPRQSLGPRKQTAIPSSSQPQPSSQQSKGVGYPILKAWDIVDIFHSLGIMIQEEDINKPTAQAIQGVWKMLLEETSGVTLEGFERPKGALLGMMQYPELLNDAVTFQMFFTHVRRLAKVAGLDSFTIQDLTRPEAPRVRDAFSGMVNFLKFRHNKLGLCDDLVQRGSDYNRRRFELEEQSRALHLDIANIKNQRAADIPRIEQAKERNERVRMALREVSAQQTVVVTELSRLVDERRGLKDQMASHQADIHALKGDIDLARSRLVQSPERLKKTIADLSRSTNNEKATLASFTKKGNELSSKLDQIAQLETEVRSLIDIQREAEDAQKLTDQAKSKLSALNNEFAKAVVAQTSNSTRIEQLNTQLANATEKLMRIRDSFAEKKERFTVTTIQLRAEYDAIVRERDADDAALKETEKEIARLTGETEIYIAENQAEANELMAEYWRLRAHVEAYMTEMRTKLGLDA
ncbi:Nuf2 family-domain-containing protein [Mrakia frigida]|uniref:Nuf2 family-domain-containing protein n=1 Tax=Mrakia frigida TaxID=29902 RepID=UPI003FCBFDB9